MNITLEGIVISIATIPVAIAFIVLVNHLQSNRNKAMIFFAFAWGTICVTNILAAIGYSQQIMLLIKIRDVLYIPLCVSLLIGIDFTERERIDFKKLLVLGILSTILVFNLLEPEELIYDVLYNQPTLSHNGNIVYSLSILTAYGGLIYLGFAVNLYRNSPKKLKRFARLNLFGAISFAIMAPLVTILRLTTIIPGIAEVFIGIGALCNAIAFSKEPKLVFILPFKVTRLIVINTNSGTAVYNHFWIKNDQEIDANLVTGLFQGISTLANETLNKGNVREIYLERAVLIVSPNKEKSLATILEVSNPSQSLRKSINLFMNEFTEKFQEVIGKNEDVTFDSNAGALIQECFPYVPEY